ncbi:MAG: hypothetical protein N3B12_06525, partial [Armatimonadetes bacterium]|nr:hypothetical protein [Armatimonadota bacterium]
MLAKFVLPCVLWWLSVPSRSATDPPCIRADGKPFFVIGCYDYPGGDDLNPAHLKEMADAGINTVHWTINCVH